MKLQQYTVIKKKCVSVAVPLKPTQVAVRKEQRKKIDSERETRRFNQFYRINLEKFMINVF